MGEKAPRDCCRGCCQGPNGQRVGLSAPGTQYDLDTGLCLRRQAIPGCSGEGAEEGSRGPEPRNRSGRGAPSTWARRPGRRAPEWGWRGQAGGVEAKGFRRSAHSLSARSNVASRGHIFVPEVRSPPPPAFAHFSFARISRASSARWPGWEQLGGVQRTRQQESAQRRTGRRGTGPAGRLGRWGLPRAGPAGAVSLVPGRTLRHASAALSFRERAGPTEGRPAPPEARV